MDVQWDSKASLMRVAAAHTTDLPEELEARGTVRELVASALAMPADRQRGLLLRVSSADDTVDYDQDEIRELAAHPGFTGVAGADDTAALDRDAHAQDVGSEDRGGQVGGPTGVHPRP